VGERAYSTLAGHGRECVNTLHSVNTFSPILCDNVTDQSICTHINQELLNGFSWNLVWTFYHWRLLQICIINFIQSIYIHDGSSHLKGLWWCHYPWPSALASPVIPVWRYITQQGLNGFLQNFVWMLYYYRLTYIFLLLPTISNMNVMDSELARLGMSNTMSLLLLPSISK
jgi:hypothetical protein